MTPQYKLIIRHTNALNRANNLCHFDLDMNAKYGTQLKNHLLQQIAKQDKAIAAAKAGIRALREVA